jgi:hypothetical protein
MVSHWITPDYREMTIHAGGPAAARVFDAVTAKARCPRADQQRWVRRTRLVSDTQSDRRRQVSAAAMRRTRQSGLRPSW